MSDKETRNKLFQKQKEDGLVDVKFFAGNVSDVTEDEFYQESRKMDLAISKGLAKPFSFNDSKMKK